jgi:hypothetical protein
MKCSACPTEKIFARGLCQACYYRLRRNGTLERKNVSRAGKCIVEGCNEKPFAKNLCSRHYDKSKHPLTATWKLLRSRHPGLYPSEWDRFDAFLIDVGDRPGPRHQLRRIDGNLPFSKTNIQWLEPVTAVSNHKVKDYQSAYNREWNVRMKFGITGEDYDRMFQAQGGKCAICGESETAVDPRSGRPKALAIDHDHGTGAVRGLLDVRCNRILGYARDNREVLRRAIAYLERHSAVTADQRPYKNDAISIMGGGTGSGATATIKVHAGDVGVTVFDPFKGL